MRIAFDARAWERPPHSFGRVLRLLALSADRAGWEVEFWTEGEITAAYEPYRLRVRQGEEAWQRTRAEVLWSPQPSFLRSGLPSVATVHDINPLLPDGRNRAARWLRAVQFRARTRESLESAWRVASDSRDARDRIARAFPGPAHKLRVVGLFADQDMNRPADALRDARLAELGLSPGYILFLGSLRRHKNWDGLIRAYAALPEPLRRDHPLVLAGPSRRAGKRARALARRLAVSDRVVLPGTPPDDRLAALSAGEITFVFPSFLEGFGLPPLEAMACGVPVVASDRTSIPEVLGDAPLYVDPSRPETITAAMERVLDDAPLRDRLREAGLARAAAFGPERTGEMMRQVLAERERPT